MFSSQETECWYTGNINWESGDLPVETQHLYVAKGYFTSEIKRPTPKTVQYLEGRLICSAFQAFLEASKLNNELFYSPGCLVLYYARFPTIQFRLPHIQH